MAQLTEYGKAVKKRLIDIEQSQDWLSAQITDKTGLFVDSSYLYKIFTGQRHPQTVMSAITEILSLDGDGNG